MCKIRVKISTRRKIKIIVKKMNGVKKKKKKWKKKKKVNDNLIGFLV